MAREDARRAVRETYLSGYRHHSHTEATHLLRLYLMGQSGIREPEGLGLMSYADVLGPNQIRSVKNSLICLVTVVCRAAIDLGVDAERSFALSAYYIQTLEQKRTLPELDQIRVEIYQHYAELVQAERFRAYSLPVTRAIRFIRRKLYEPCRVSEVAEAVGLSLTYFSSLFKAEVGMEPSAYIRAQKLEEAVGLLAQSGRSVGEIGELLGFCSTSHFTREFRRVYGVTPKQYRLHGGPDHAGSGAAT